MCLNASEKVRVLLAFLIFIQLFIKVFFVSEMATVKWFYSSFFCIGINLYEWFLRLKHSFAVNSSLSIVVKKVILIKQ